MSATKNSFRKDQSLDQLATLINVAQFVSYGPGSVMHQTFSRVLGFEPNHVFNGLDQAAEQLLLRSPESSVNVRSFALDDPRSKEFVYGLTTVDEISAAARRIAETGLFVILNETVDIKDGGVSGVLQGETIEFAPDDTPRCVEKPGVASLPSAWGLELLSKVYGFRIEAPAGNNYRLEFTVHPRPRGWKHTHLLGWELEPTDNVSITPSLTWPNRFSRHIGDKAFGQLIAAEVGLPVPKTLVISRRVAPFVFGVPTGSAERWIRTCPKEQVPGKFTTHRGWLDPFELLASEDPRGVEIASVLCQDAVPSEYSGAAIVTRNGDLVVEGRKGEGEVLMRGIAKPESLPQSVIGEVERVYRKAQEQLGPVRFEWVHDGDKVWVVQLHRGATSSVGTTLVPGSPARWNRFEVTLGLEALRLRLNELSDDEGLLLIGSVGLTSHVADVVRKVGKPARIE